MEVVCRDEYETYAAILQLSLLDKKACTFFVVEVVINGCEKVPVVFLCKAPRNTFHPEVLLIIKSRIKENWP